MEIKVPVDDGAVELAAQCEQSIVCVAVLPPGGRKLKSALVLMPPDHASRLLRAFAEDRVAVEETRQ